MQVAESNTGPKEGVKGVVEDVKGKAKEAAGKVFGDDSLAGEGQAQQDKASSQREAAEHQAAFEQGRVPEPFPTYVAGYKQLGCVKFRRRSLCGSGGDRGLKGVVGARFGGWWRSASAGCPAGAWWRSTARSPWARRR